MTQLPTTIREPVTPPAPALPGPAVETSVSFQDVVSILRRRLILILFLLVVFAGLATGGWFVAYRYFPLYPGEALVECISDKPKPVFTAADQALNQKEFERFVMTQAAFAKSPDVLMDVLRTAEVQDSQWYRDHKGPRVLLDFEELVRAVPVRGTNLLRISVETRSENDPHVIVNQLTEHYLSKIKENNVGAFRRERTSYQNDLEAVNKQIGDKQAQLLELQTRLPPGFAGFESNVAAVGYGEAKEAVAQLELTTQELEGLYSVYSQPGGAALSPEDIQFVEADPTIAALSNQLFAVRQQLAVERGELGANHQEVKRLEQTQTVIEEQLAKLRQQKSTEVRAFRQEQVQTAWLTSQHALLLARERLADAEAYIADMDTVATQYRLLEEELELLKEKRAQINDYIDEVERIVRERSAIRVEPRQMAIPPLERSFPSLVLLPAGWLLALVLAIGIPLALELVDTSLRTPVDMARHLRVPVLGVLPHADDEEIDIKRLETAAEDAPRSMFAEVFRTIRTNLQFAAPADRQRSIVITSPRPEDGKTTVACNLAIAVAAGGRRVLLVDANLRRPAVHRVFSVQSDGGLSDVLVGGAKLVDVVRQTGHPNLEVLAAGRLPPNPAELLASSEMKELIAEAVRMYDQVLLDAPPVLLASDACALGANTDGVILVCRAKVNSRGIGSRACGLLHHVEAHIFGAVLNAAQVRRGGYFREQLRTYYDYQADDAEAYGGKVAALPRREEGAQVGDDSTDRGRA